MFRKLAILSLTFAALLVGLPGAWSYFQPVCLPVPLTDRQFGYIYFADGLVRFYAYQANDDVYLRGVDGFRNVIFQRQADDSIVLRITHAPPWQIQNNDIVSTRFQGPPGPQAVSIALYGLRMRVSVLVAICMVYPVAAIVADLWRRRRRIAAGFCRSCEYDLTGNESGYCPECGAGVVRDGRCRGCAEIVPTRRSDCPYCGLPIATEV